MLWAGILIALSIGLYGTDRPYLGFALGLAAVFFRDVALPYCVLAAGLAWWEGRRRELGLWLAGLTGWCLFFAVHWLKVQPLVPADAQAHYEGWVQFGGTAFVISTTQMSGYLLLLPQWVTALYFVLAMLGYAGWNTPLGRRAGFSACIYVVAFGMVGQEFNQYWGALVAPLWCFGIAQAPGALRDLLRRAAGSDCSTSSAAGRRPV
jgi:hypothetical protein